MADKECTQKLAFTFLQDLRQKFFDIYTPHEIENAKSYSLKSFGFEWVKPKMQLYNDNPDIAKDKTDQVLQSMLSLKEDMVENIDKLIQRDGKIEIIAEKAQ